MTGRAVVGRSVFGHAMLGRAGLPKAPPKEAGCKAAKVTLGGAKITALRTARPGPRKRALPGGRREGARITSCRWRGKWPVQHRAGNVSPAAVVLGRPQEARRLPGFAPRGLACTCVVLQTPEPQTCTSPGVRRDGGQNSSCRTPWGLEQRVRWDGCFGRAARALDALAIPFSCG